MWLEISTGNYGLTKQCLKIDASFDPYEMYTSLQITQNNDLQILMKTYFLVPEDKDECVFYEGMLRILKLYHSKKGCSLYTIIPTMACNARCIYCFENGFKPVTMTQEIVDRTIEYIETTHDPDSTVVIYWFGGEPLLGERIIDQICSALKEKKILFQSETITNASLINDAITDKMTGLWQMKGIQFSVDGSEQEYIKRKCYLKYDDTYKKVLKNINLLAERGISVIIRCNVDENNLDSLPGFLNDLSSIVKHKEKIQLYFAPLIQARSSENDLYVWNNLIPYEDIVRQMGFQLAGYVQTSRHLSIHHCMADDLPGSVVISPDGKLYGCDFCQEESLCGDIFHGVTMPETRAVFADTDHTPIKCRTCTFLPDCTPFHNCPYQDFHCKEVWMMRSKNYLRRLIQDMKGNKESPKEMINC